jgi:hypothetical protein
MRSGENNGMRMPAGVRELNAQPLCSISDTNCLMVELPTTAIGLSLARAETPRVCNGPMMPEERARTLVMGV